MRRMIKHRSTLKRTEDPEIAEQRRIIREEFKDEKK